MSKVKFVSLTLLVEAIQAQNHPEIYPVPFTMSMYGFWLLTFMFVVWCEGRPITDFFECEQLGEENGKEENKQEASNAGWKIS